MRSLPADLRNRLAATIKAARRAGESGARNALGMLAVGDARAHASMSAAEQDLRRRLRAHGRQLGDRYDADTGVQAIARLVHEVAYEHWHRMLFARFLAENHLLIESLDLLVRLRMEEEHLAPGDAIDAVLRDNLFGLEIDARRTQIATFNLALTAWTWPAAGGYRRLPDLNLACSGLAPNAPRDEWTRLSEDAADAGGLPPKRDLLGVDDALLSAPLRNSLGALHDLFAQAPVLGSLIDRRVVQADLYQHDYESVRVLVGALLQREHTNDEQTERAVAAQGMARAAELLAGRHHLVVTNVPYLARGKQSDALKQFAQDRHPAAKGDLATLFVSRIFGWLDKHGVQAVVTPQNWLFLTSYKKLRETLLKRRTWNLVARLGPGAFETVTGEVVKACLLVLNRSRPTASRLREMTRRQAGEMCGLDVTDSPTVQEKAAESRRSRISTVRQIRQFENPDARIVVEDRASMPLLSEFADALVGLQTSDDAMFVIAYWELRFIDKAVWEYLQSTPERFAETDGLSWLVRWERGRGALLSLPTAYPTKGLKAIGRVGVAVHRMQRLFAYRYGKERFHQNVAVIVPVSESRLAAVWCFCSSPEYHQAVRRIDQKLNVTNATLVKVPFDLDRWTAVAQERYPNGLPEPYSDDPTQWIFHGHPCGSVVWDEDAKWTAHGACRVDAAVLQVAVARLLGYRWPAEHDPDMRLAAEMRAWVDRCRHLEEFADADGIVCLSSLGGEPAAVDRLRQLLAAAYGGGWSAAMERQLLVAAVGSAEPVHSIETWLRDRFFEQHCQRFRQRPFIWHIWDGRRDGFHALVNYQRLAGPNDEGRRTLEALTYSYLGDWIARQKADRDQGTEGAEGRLAAAQDLLNQLEKIVAGEPPCDLFVRWKPLGEQPIGWEPDINDGVRVNIRPFMSVELARGGRAGAGILRAKPKIAWGRDRGREALKARRRRRPPWLEDDVYEADANDDRELRPREDYPWFWGCPGDGTEAERTDFLGSPGFDGNRWNDLHYTNPVKRAARSRKIVEGGS